MLHEETRTKIGTALASLISKGYSVDVHHNRITGQYRVVCVHHCSDSEFVTRDPSLLGALTNALFYTVD